MYEQLKARPSPWGKGLWKDEETEKIAERCAQIFVENFLECPNERLIPQDPMEMVMALNDTGDLEDVEAIEQIESEFTCKIPEGFFQKERTFEELVECVKKGKGKAPPEKLTATDVGGCLFGCILMSVIFIVLPCYSAYRVYSELATGFSEGWEQVEVGTLIGHSSSMMMEGHHILVTQLNLLSPSSIMSLVASRRYGRPWVRAFCERSPRIRPHLIVASPRGRARRFGVVNRLSNAFGAGASSPRRGASARVIPNDG